MKFRRLPTSVRVLTFLTLWSSSTATFAAGDQALLLADGLMDKEAVCAAYVQGQQGAIYNIAISWGTSQPEVAGQALYSELLPLLADICSKSWAVARVTLADAIEAEMSVEDRTSVYKFLSSSAGEKFLKGARDGAVKTVNGADPGPPPSLTVEEKASGQTTFATTAWSKYKLLGAQAQSLFGAAQAQESGPYRGEFASRMNAVKARFGG